MKERTALRCKRNTKVKLVGIKNRFLFNFYNRLRVLLSKTPFGHAISARSSWLFVRLRHVGFILWRTLSDFCSIYSGQALLAICNAKSTETVILIIWANITAKQDFFFKPQIKLRFKQLNKPGRQKWGCRKSSVNRRSMQSYILTYSKLTKKKKKIHNFS